MRLFLSSYRAGKKPYELVKLFGKGSKVAVITNAKDYKSELERKESVDEVTGYLEELGFKTNELDLRDFFNKPEVLQKELSKYPAVWVAGGNTFIVRRAMKYSGADKLITDMVKNNKIAYGGESAGAILATPSFTGVEFGDSPDIVPEHYKKEVISEGLGFVSYHIVPHYKSEWLGAEDMIKALKKQKLDFKTLTDEDAILVNGREEKSLK